MTQLSVRHSRVSRVMIVECNSMISSEIETDPLPAVPRAATCLKQRNVVCAKRLPVDGKLDLPMIRENIMAKKVTTKKKPLALEDFATAVHNDYLEIRKDMATKEDIR